MNNQLTELAKQAGLKKEYGSDQEYIGDFDWREFAKLIIIECASVAKSSDDALLNHFGIVSTNP